MDRDAVVEEAVRAAKGAGVEIDSETMRSLLDDMMGSRALEPSLF